MAALTVNNLPPAGVHDDAVRCVFAIELSKKSWIVAMNTPLSDKISGYTLKPCDGKGLLDLCERIRTRVAGETRKRVEIGSCYEARYDGFWLHRLLEAHGIRNYDRHQGCVPVQEASTELDVKHLRSQIADFDDHVGRNVIAARGGSDSVGTRCLIEAVGLLFVGAKEREEPLNTFLVVRAFDGARDFPGHLKLLGKVSFNQEARHDLPF